VNTTIRRYSRYIKSFFLLWDLVLLNIAYIISFYIRFGNLDKLVTQDNGTVILLSNVFWLLMGLDLGTYTIIRTEKIEKILYRSIKLFTYHFILIFSSVMLLGFDDISRRRLFYFYILFFVLVIVFRIVFISILKHLRRQGFNYRNVVIAGTEKEGMEIYNLLSRDLVYGYKLLGFFDDTESSKDKVIDYLGPIDKIEEYIKNNNVHELYWTLDNYDPAKVKSLIDFCENHLIRIKFIPAFRRYIRNRYIKINFYDYIPVVLLRKEPLEEPINRIMKRLSDIFISFLVIILVFPWLFPILILLVKTSSKGPVFFRQKRSGEDNRTFYCWKFRTMRVNADADTHQASKGDLRITRTGRFLRKSNLDELPQIFNVLIGDMSLVGPRPHMLLHTEEYSALIKNYLVRHFVRPGITGWAQVNGYRGETKELSQMEKRIEYDIWYIENWSFYLDIKILFMTGMNMFKGEENAG
jgi:putative colanic acid biosysnthesis UDP-glucose lipid carrier transferase